VRSHLLLFADSAAAKSVYSICRKPRLNISGRVPHTTGQIAALKLKLGLRVKQLQQDSSSVFKALCKLSMKHLPGIEGLCLLRLYVLPTSMVCLLDPPEALALRSKALSLGSSILAFTSCSLASVQSYCCLFSTTLVPFFGPLRRSSSTSKRTWSSLCSRTL
jgi:hypothetical protein